MYVSLCDHMYFPMHAGWLRRIVKAGNILMFPTTMTFCRLSRNMSWHFAGCMVA